MARYYLCGLVLDAKERFVLWFENEPDGVLILPSGKIAAFATLDAAIGHAHERRIDLESAAPVWYDFDRLARWCAAPHPEAIDCRLFVDAWNLIGDLQFQTSSMFQAVNRRSSSVYNKLFFGVNLPSTTPSGEHYSPGWDDAELRELVRLFSHGLNELRHRVFEAAA
jgi:hypothetical protein